MMKRVAFYTLGCKVNQYDTEAMMEKFQERGYKIVDFSEEADVYVINSCTVTGQGAKKSRQMVRRAKAQNPRAIVGLAGCYSQTEPERVLEMDEIDFIIGTQNREMVVDVAEEAAVSSGPVNAVRDLWDDTGLSFEELPINELHERTRASIKIQEGCNQFCSYCIIPYARGPLRSRAPENIFAELSRLCARGVKEFVLTGIHLGAYGVDRDGEYNLTDLIRDILDRVPELERLRLSSLEVTEVDSRLVEMIAREERLCRHLHLPLQSGSDEVLRRMNRPYTSGEFLARVKEIKETIPEICISTDIMVGFPGETEEEFLATYNLVREAGFGRMHVFKFSPRPGTPAAKMKPRVGGRTKQIRSEKLRILGETLQMGYYRRFLGSKLKVLVEEERHDGFLTGLTDNYIRVIFQGDDSLKGNLVKVKLVEIADKERVLGQRS